MDTLRPENLLAATVLHKGTRGPPTSPEHLAVSARRPPSEDSGANTTELAQLKELPACTIRWKMGSENATISWSLQGPMPIESLAQANVRFLGRHSTQTLVEIQSDISVA